jgi:type VI secretion system protein ImpB
MRETQHLLDKIRPPRVQITYDVEIGDAIEMKELPFVVGVLADLSGDRDPNVVMPAVRERKFTEIDRDNFNEIMGKISPRVTFQAENMLAEESGDMFNVALTFKKIDDFDPVNILKQIPALAELYETRTMLRDLLTKLDGNDKLDTLLTKVLETPEAQNQIKSALKLGNKPAADAGEDAKPKDKK